MSKATKKATTKALLLPVAGKKIYPTNPQEKQIVKHYENYNLYQRFVTDAQNRLKAQGFNPAKDQQNPLFSNALIDVNAGQQLADKEAKKIALLEAKGINLQQALQHMYFINLSKPFTKN